MIYEVINALGVSIKTKVLTVHIQLPLAEKADQFEIRMER